MITIGLVDDHQMFLDGLKAILLDQPDLEVLFCESKVSSALKKMETEQPDIIITDISMPEINGLEFIKILKKQYPDIRILVVSMFKNVLSFDDVDGFLLKDSDKDEFLLAIHKIYNDEKYFINQKPVKDNFEFKKTLLTAREKEIIRLIAEEHTSDEIANTLFLSKGTVETHRKNIFTKMNVKNIAGLVKKAIYLGIIES